MSYPGLSADGLQLPHHHTHKRGLSLSVAAYEGNFLSPLYFYIRVAEYHLLRVTHSQAGRLIDHISRTRSRREFDIESGIVSFIDFNALYLLKGLDSGLHLIGLGRLVAEALYEVLRFFYHLLLVRIRGCLLLHTLCSEHKILGIRHFIVLYMSENHFHGTVGHPVEEFPVVGNQHKRALSGCKVILQPLNGFYVQMVGRLVE